MLRITEQLRMSEYSNLYEILIPENHLLRRIKSLVDFSFIMDELMTKYCLDNGRDAINPIRLFKYLLLKVMYKLSDRTLVERSKYDMSFKFFLDYLPEDNVISHSELTKFRKQRLQDAHLLDLLINKSVEIAIEQGVLKSKNIIVDSTHSTSRFHSRSPQEVLQEQAKDLRKAVYQVNADMKSKFPTKVTGSDLTEHIDYCKELLETINADSKLMIYEDIRDQADLLKEMIDDNLEHLKLSIDEDAKTGHKSADTSFFGYKTHIAMTEDRIITAAVVTSGEKADGKYLSELVKKSRQAGVTVEAVIGDTAYSEKENIETAKDNYKLISKLNPCVTEGLRKKEDEFEFNKDAEMFVCKAGHMATSKTIRHSKQPDRKENPRLVYYFDIEKCKRCSLKEGCYKEGSKSKSYSVTLISDVQLEHKRFQESATFKLLASQRYMIEAKNGELKNCHEYGVSESSGINAMEIQGATTLFAANLKRIVQLVG